MNRKELVTKLVKEGFSETTLCKFNDKQLEKFANKVLSEQTSTATLNIPKDNKAAVDSAKKNKQTFVTYEEKDIEEKGKEKWIQKAIDPKKKGQLHKDLDVPQDEVIPVSKLKAAAKKGGKVGRRARMALNLRNLNEFVDNVVDNTYHSLTTKGEMVELIKTKVSTISEKEEFIKLPEFMDEAEVAEPDVKPDVKPAPTKPGTDTPPKERPSHPGKRPVDPNKNPLPDPAPKATGKEISGDQAKSKIIQMVHRIFSNN